MSKFTFTAEAKALEAIVKTCSTAIASYTRTPIFCLMAKNQELFAISFDQGCFCMIRVANSQSEGNGFASVDSDLFLGSIKGRSIMSFEFTGNELKFQQTKGKYVGNLVTAPISQDQHSTIQNFLNTQNSGTKLSAETVASIKTGISITGIKDVYKNEPILSYISIVKKELSVSARHQNHFAVYSDVLSEGKNIQIAIPFEYFSTIDNVVANNSASFGVNKSQLIISGKSFKLCLPAIQADDKEFDMLHNYIDTLKTPKVRCELKLSELSKIIDNVGSLYKEGGAGFEFKIKPNALKISLQTSNGNASDQIAIKANDSIDFSVDTRLFKDILGLAKSTKTEKLFVYEKLIMLKGEKDTANILLACARQL